ncbi:MAG: N-glycosylase/DNA lyase [Candidatus Methanomethylicaceae archaeon]
MEELLKKAVRAYEQKFGVDSRVLNLHYVGRVLHVEFGGNVATSCCAFDYFDDFCLTLEEVISIPHAIISVSRDLNRFSVKMARLDFLDEIKSAIHKCEQVVKSRLKEFEENGKSENSAFKELCFCILTANFSAEGGIRIQKSIGDGFLTLPKKELYDLLVKLGHRFPSSRADYIVEARKYYGYIMKTINSFDCSQSARDWLSNNIKGIGYKEASHFLRNIGVKDLAIVDRHILRYLQSKSLIDKPKTLTKRKYLEIESILSVIAERLEITLAELDLYLWYLITGKILK